MLRAISRSFILFVAAFSISCEGGRAQTKLWNPDGRPVCTASGWQKNVRIASDGASGAILAWEDIRTGSLPAIYVTRLKADSTLPWTPDGILLSAASTGQTLGGLAADGKGGAFVTWWNRKNGTSDIFIQHVDANGNLLWPQNGTAICDAPKDQQWVNIVNDGFGGAILAWQDSRSDTNDVYAQRLDNTGHTLWATNGILVTGAPGNQNYPELAPDGLGGAYVVWMDRRTEDDIYAQYIRSDGSRAWTDDLPISAFPNRQLAPKIVPHTGHTAAILWQDYRISTTVSAIYIQIVDSSGGQFFLDGHQLATSNESQSGMFFTADGHGGALATWTDFRNGLTDGDVFMGRINPDGSIPSQSSASGDPVCVVGGSAQELAQIVPDSAGGAFVAWQDKRNTYDYDLYMNRVSAIDEANYAGWDPNGVPLAQNDHSQIAPQIVPSGRGRAIVVWTDGRVADGQADIYAQRVAYAPWLSISVDTLDFGIHRVGEMVVDTITVTNTGAVPLTISEIRRPPGGDAADFRVLSVFTFPLVVPVDSSFEIAVSFMPKGVDRRQAELHFRSDFSVETVRLPLVGIGTDPRIITLSSFVFPPTKIGDTRDTVLTRCIQNVGNGVLIVDSLVLGGPMPDQFRLPAPPPMPAVLEPYETLDLPVRYRPTTEGVHEAEILVFNNSTDSVKPIAVSGAAGQPRFESNPVQVHFDNTMLTRSSTKQLSIVNAGNYEMRVDTMYLLGINRESFDFDWPGRFSIPNNGFRAITVRFKPQSLGNLIASLTIVTDAPGSPHYVDMDGTGIELNPVEPVPSTAGFRLSHIVPNPVSGATSSVRLVWDSGASAPRGPSMFEIFDGLGRRRARISVHAEPGTDRSIVLPAGAFEGLGPGVYHYGIRSGARGDAVLGSGSFTVLP